MEYPHWLMVAGACSVLVGSIGLAFHKNTAEPPGNNLKQAAPPNPLRLPKAGLKTVREVREIPDETLLSFHDLGKDSIAHLRETPMGLKAKGK